MINRKTYQKIRVVVSLFVATIVGISVTNHSYLLSFAGVLTGMIFLLLVRVKAHIRTDEREVTIQEKAAKITYSIFTPTIGISALLMLIPSHSGLSVFSRGEFLFLESLGMVFAYLVLFMITIYACAYYVLNKKYSGGPDEK